jgi:hypothetical protein
LATTVFPGLVLIRSSCLLVAEIGLAFHPSEKKILGCGNGEASRQGCFVKMSYFSLLPMNEVR